MIVIEAKLNSNLTMKILSWEARIEPEINLCFCTPKVPIAISSQV